jgi:hypothetical protein
MARRYHGHGAFGDLLEFFKGAERKYAAFDAKLEKLPQLDAGRTAAMIAFAYHIEEPGEAAKWTERLAREHPDDPGALSFYTDMLRYMENRGAPADSIRRLLPRLASLGARAPIWGRFFRDAQGIVDRYGDAGMQRQWALRAARAGQGTLYFSQRLADRWLADPEIRDALVEDLQHTVGEGCSTSNRHYSKGRAYFNWQTNCVRRRLNAFNELSRIALLQRRLSAALEYADSSVAIDAASGGCFGRESHRARANARLAAGDITGAAESFAKSFWFNDGKQETAAERDSIRRLVASAMDSASFVRLVAGSEQEMLACQQKRHDARKAAERQ